MMMRFWILQYATVLPIHVVNLIFSFLPTNNLRLKLNRHYPWSPKPRSLLPPLLHLLPGWTLDWRWRSQRRRQWWAHALPPPSTMLLPSTFSHDPLSFYLLPWSFVPLPIMASARIKDPLIWHGSQDKRAFSTFIVKTQFPDIIIIIIINIW